MIESMDQQIGRVLQALEVRGLAENTLIIFTSDNGGERFSDTWPFSGKKTELLEGGLRVPAIVSWPGRIAADRTTDQVAITMDWLPTLLAAAGTQAHPDYPSDGINLLPQLTADAAPAPRTLYWRYKGHAQRAIRDGDLKALKIREQTFLFNVVNDPLERANLKARQPSEYARLVHDWYKWSITMLPETKESFTHGIDGEHWADHIGTPAVSQEPDLPTAPDE